MTTETQQPAKINNFSVLQQSLSFRTENISPNFKNNMVAILPRGEAIRNFVYSNALDQLNLETELTLLTVLPSDEIHDLLLARYKNVLELVEIDEAYAVRSLRDLLDMAHGRWLWSEAAKERWRLRDHEATTVNLQIKRLLKKTVCYPFANPLGLRILSKMERTASSWLRTTNQYINLFEKLNPTLVFNGSHIHSKIATQAVQAAQWLGIPTATFLFSWDNLTSQGRIILDYDYYLVWNTTIRNQLLEIYPSINPQKVFVTGTPQFDFHFKDEFRWTREKFCARLGADPSRPIILYSTGMANHMPGEPEIVEGIAEALSEMTEFGPPQLLVRIYPKDLTGRFDSLRRKRPDILFPEVPWEPAWLTPKLEDAFLLTNTLLHSAVGINVASTISLELCMFDKPVINIGYNPDTVNTLDLDYSRYYLFDHYRPVVESRAVEIARSPDELRSLLQQALKDPSARMPERRALTRQFFGETLDGNSGNRVADALQEIIFREKKRSTVVPQNK
jgi:hypothetical protein